MKQKYIWITPEFHNELETPKVRVEVYLSAYDVPKAVCGMRDTQRNEFVIHFDYIDNEPGEIIDLADDGITLLAGKHSGRLLGITIDLKTLGIEDTHCIVELEPKLVKAIDDYANKNSGSRNLDAAKRVIEKKLGELVS